MNPIKSLVLLLVFLAISACQDTRTGAQGGACYGNGTCDDNLVCVFGSCQAPVDTGKDGGNDGDHGDGAVDPACEEGEKLCRDGDVDACKNGVWTTVQDCGAGVCDDGECVTTAGDCATTCGTGTECDGQDCDNGGSCYSGTCLTANECYLTQGWCTSNFTISRGFVGCSSTAVPNAYNVRSTHSYCSPTNKITDIGRQAPEQVWAYVATTSGQRTVTVIPLTNWDVGLYVAGGQCAPSLGCHGEVDQGGPGEPETITFATNATQVYTIFVDGVRDSTVGGGNFSGSYVITMD